MSHTPSIRLAPSADVSSRTPPPEASVPVVGWQPWPVHVEKQLGVPSVMLFGSLAVTAILQLLPSLLTGLPLSDVLRHTNAGVTFAIMAAVMALLWLVLRNRGELTVDHDGIDVRQRSRHYVYDWSDIERLDEVRGGVKISLKGRSADQNRYNVINARFSGSAGELSQMLSEGLSLFGAGRGPSGRTVAPGDDLRSARIRSSVSGWLLLVGTFFAIFAGVAAWQGAECLKALELKSNGQRAEAAVARIYTGACGPGGCSLDAEFTYVSGQDGRTHTGHGYLASDRDGDAPDLVWARTRKTVPIVYDPALPQVAMLNFEDRVFRKDPVERMLTMIAITGGLIGGLTLLFTAFLAPLLIRAYRTPKASAEGQPA